VNFKVSESKVKIRTGDIESDWILLPLDTPDNINRLLSLELTGAWISEAREVAPEIAMNVLSRCGRYPSKIAGGPTWYGLIMESNSFNEDSPWYELLEEELPSNWGYFVQPSGLSPDAENVENLPATYYEDLITANSEDWVKQYVENKIQGSLAGQAVFANSFIPDFHISTDEIPVTSGYPLCIGMDFARHPAAIITQIDHQGRFNVLAELEAPNMGLEKFIFRYLVPLLATKRFVNKSVYIVGDPSGVARGNIGEESIFEALKRLGYIAYPAMTNYIDPRLRAVEKYMVRQIGGKAGFLVDKLHCPLLIRALRSEYRFKQRKNGEMEEKPDKRRPWADLSDALQYACLGSSPAIRGRIMQPVRPSAPPPPAAGWT
jgi:hypothetical protein